MADADPIVALIKRLQAAAYSSGIEDESERQSGKRQKACLDAMLKARVELDDAITRTRAEAEALRADAERYRWIRKVEFRRSMHKWL